MDADGVKKWRVIIDYRLLNEQMINDEYLLPRIEDILDRLVHAKFFTTLDLASGFHQIPVKLEDQKKQLFPSIRDILSLLVCPMD